jgi:hypothetical protein
VSAGHGQARTGEIERTPGGWAIRYRDGKGVRRQNGGFRTKAEAKIVLDEELRKRRGSGRSIGRTSRCRSSSTRSWTSTRARRRARAAWISTSARRRRNSVTRRWPR